MILHLSQMARPEIIKAIYNIDFMIHAELKKWLPELSSCIEKSRGFIVFIFSDKGELLSSNAARVLIDEKDPSGSINNPTFDKLLEITSQEGVFEGVITFNSPVYSYQSADCRAFRKDDRLLISGSVNLEEILDHNSSLYSLNREISDLQRMLIREKKMLEIKSSELRKKNQELLQMNVDRDSLYSVIAHDLKSPFNGILSLADLLSGEIADYSREEIQEMAGLIQQSAQNAHDLLTNLLEWVRAQSGGIKFNPEQVTLKEIFEGLENIAGMAAREKNISLHFHSDTDDVIVADRVMIAAVLRNLVSNAIKFTPGGGSIELRISREKNGRIRFSVKDTGRGMAAETIDKILTGEDIVSTPGTDREPGTGLGLRICKKFIKDHGSKLEISSEEGRGSSFSFSVPQN